MAPTKWNPFMDLLFFQGRMNRLFDEALGKFGGGGPVNGSAWYPAVDIYETGENIIVKAEIPGIDASSVTIEVHGNNLTLKGERRHAKNLKEENYLRMERFYGQFHREITLQAAVDKNGITAQFKDGVLKILIPKVMEGAPGSIKVPVL